MTLRCWQVQLLTDLFEVIYRDYAKFRIIYCKEIGCVVAIIVSVFFAASASRGDFGHNITVFLLKIIYKKPE